MDKKLEVGQILYGQSAYNGIDKITIDRVTATQAIAGQIKLKRDFMDGNREIGASGYGCTNYYLPTTEWAARYEEQQLRRKLKKLIEQPSKFTLTQVRAIIKTLTDAKGV